MRIFAREKEFLEREKEFLELVREVRKLKKRETHYETQIEILRKKNEVILKSVLNLVMRIQKIEEKLKGEKGGRNKN